MEHTNKRYTITVSAIGYDTINLTVPASSKLLAKINHELDALKKFADQNALSMRDARVLGSISYTKR